MMVQTSIKLNQDVPPGSYVSVEGDRGVLCQFQWQIETVTLKRKSESAEELPCYYMTFNRTENTWNFHSQFNWPVNGPKFPRNLYDGGTTTLMLSGNTTLVGMWLYDCWDTPS